MGGNPGRGLANSSPKLVDTFPTILIFNVPMLCVEMQEDVLPSSADIPTPRLCEAFFAAAISPLHSRSHGPLGNTRVAPAQPHHA
jgi:hypothetical protein